MIERYYKSTEDFIKNLDKNYDPVYFEKDFTKFLNKLIQPKSDNQSKTNPNRKKNSHGH